MHNNFRIFYQQVQLVLRSKQLRPLLYKQTRRIMQVCNNSKNWKKRVGWLTINDACKGINLYDMHAYLFIYCSATMIDDGKFVGAVILNLAKAFEHVNHDNYITTEVNMLWC